MMKAFLAHAWDGASEVDFDGNECGDDGKGLESQSLAYCTFMEPSVWQVSECGCGIRRGCDLYSA